MQMMEFMYSSPMPAGTRERIGMLSRQSRTKTEEEGPWRADAQCRESAHNRVPGEAALGLPRLQAKPTLSK